MGHLTSPWLLPSLTDGAVSSLGVAFIFISFFVSVFGLLGHLEEFVGRL